MSVDLSLEEFVLLPSAALVAMRNVANGYQDPENGMMVMYHQLKAESIMKFTEQLNQLEREYERKVAAAVKGKKEGPMRAAPAVKEQEQEASTPNVEKIERELDRLMEDWHNGQRQ